jgi:hypothetical protein
MTIEDRLSDTLAHRASSVATTRIASDAVVVVGRAAVRRRRVAAITTVAASVTALITIAAIAVTGGPQGARPPGDIPSPSTPPSQSDPAGFVPGVLGLSVLYRNTIFSADGTSFVLPFADGVAEVVLAENGWVVLTGAQDGQSLWYVPRWGQAARIGSPGGNFKVSSDGTVLVVTGINGRSNVDAYRLPSLERFQHTTFDSGTGPRVAGIAGDRALLNGAQGSPGASTAAVWNLRTGSLRKTAVDVWVWGVARDGRVLRRVDRFVPGTKDRLNACVDVVTMTDTLPTGDTGYCDNDWLDVGGASLSPSGDWAVVNVLSKHDSAGPPILIRTDELHRDGRLSARPMEPQGRVIPEFWASDEAFITSPMGDGKLFRCTTTGSCTPIILRSDVPAQRLLPPMI